MKVGSEDKKIQSLHGEKKRHGEEKCMDSFAQFGQFYGPLRGKYSF